MFTCGDLDLKIRKQEDDLSLLYSDKYFSTYQHVNREDCPAYDDNSKKIHTKPIVHEGRVYYPCNIGGCLEGCPCIPCNRVDEYGESNSFKCPSHNPDHPEMFDDSEDLALERRMYFEVESGKPIYERPKFDNKLCPPKIEFARMKKKC